MKTLKQQWKLTSVTLLMLTGLLGTAQAVAQDCQVSLSNSTVDFGRVIQPSTNDALNAGNMHALGDRVISLNAICPSGSKVVLSLRGAQQGEQFKFAKQGNIRVSLSNAQLDGRRVELAQVKTLGAGPSAAAPSIVASPGDQVIPVSGGLPAEGSVLSVQIEVRPTVPVAELRTRDATTMESNLSFEVKTY
ncbi:MULTISPECIES: hypothetical protein [unclassified Pseudomonas]|uniref:hypothetical protein n=1 Tax=unclassified Pseudomonas TaxID=196821 RepID=UPI002AC91D1C|nr:MULTISPECIES: hypothetical protein [unclassified Pseudomonas]MEB0047315.1 hypothetical protein [Pseudomonas sp. Dout3]MEB0096567.1 hypothetical protein [Pseudomonas sp. DC1.2]WPX60312.1 hypothetical protein RHM68_06655 [Pseudomonas sp. DC1.2]